jgi:hypothetical protein
MGMINRKTRQRHERKPEMGTPECNFGFEQPRNEGAEKGKPKRLSAL